MPDQDARTEFRTASLVEGALMFMRTKSVECQWEGNVCMFTFQATEEDKDYASNTRNRVIARDFHSAMVAIKSAMYATDQR